MSTPLPLQKKKQTNEQKKVTLNWKKKQTRTQRSAKKKVTVKKKFYSRNLFFDPAPVSS
jgi:hypothetical protein